MDSVQIIGNTGLLEAESIILLYEEERRHVGA